MLSTPFLKHIKSVLQKAIQKQINLQKVQQVFGGDINQTFLLNTNQGNFFLKTNGNCPPGMFEKESAGLALLKSASVLQVPAPLAFGSFAGTGFLLMEWIEKGKPANNFWPRFGYGLAEMHKNTQPYFGLWDSNYIGSIPQINTKTDAWADFYAQHRIMPLLTIALQQHKCRLSDVCAAEKLCNRFGELLPVEPPALLHGDLWGGNFMVAGNGHAAIYDPAAYYGHREMDIAMTLLFGGFDNKFYEHYNNAYPLQHGWKDRVLLCQLYPLLVHLLLFGGHYYESVMATINTYC